MVRVPMPPAAVVLTGLPGTGKSTLADRAAAALGAPSFSGDWLLGALAPHGVLRGMPVVECRCRSDTAAGGGVDAALARVLGHAGPA